MKKLLHSEATIVITVLFLQYFYTNGLKSKVYICGARGRNRTGTAFKSRRILSPVCLPISPPGLSGCEEPEIIYYRLIFFRILSSSIINIEGN